jgi:hypothetical protein
MTDNRTVSLTISLPKHFRDILRKRASEWNLEHPDELISGAGIARDIICDLLQDWEKRQETVSGKMCKVYTAKEETPQ